MNIVGKWVKENMPGLWKFFSDFFEALSSGKSGHSLRKWLAVGFYWLMAILSLRYTNPENLVLVLGVHASMITTLIITYSVTSNADAKRKAAAEGGTNDPV